MLDWSRLPWGVLGGGTVGLGRAELDSFGLSYFRFGLVSLICAWLDSVTLGCAERATVVLDFAELCCRRLGSVGLGSAELCCNGLFWSGVC
jgi:hypothetical protein